MARRVNTGFLFSLTVVALVLACAAFIAKRRVSGPNPQKYIERAEKDLSAGLLQTAFEDYGIAAQLDRGNKDLCIRRGDVADKLSDEKGMVAVEAARTCWENALAIDPACKPALSRLLDSCLEQAELIPSGDAFAKLNDVAARSLGIDPTDARAKTCQLAATIGQWLTSAASSSDKPAADAAAALALEVKKTPSNDTAMYYAGQFGFRIARDALRAGDTDKAVAQIGRTLAMVEAATTAQPQNAALNLRAFQLYRAFALLEPKPQDQTRDRDRATAAIERAAGCAHCDDRRRTTILLTQAQWAAARGQAPAAQQILHKLWQERPDDPSVRVELAQTLHHTGDHALWEESVRILSAPARFTHEGGVGAMMDRQGDFEGRLERVRVRLDQFAAATQPTERAQRLSQVDESMKLVEGGLSGTSVAVLRLQAGVLSAHGRAAEALQTLKQAVDLMDHLPEKPAYQYELLYELAVASRAMGQNHAAEERLRTVLDAIPGFTPARVSLIELYIAEHKSSEASQQIDALSAQSPNSPDLKRLKAAFAAAGPNGDAATRVFTRLSEQAAFDQQAYATTLEHPPLTAAGANGSGSPTTLPADPFEREGQIAWNCLTQGKLREGVEHLRAADRIKPNQSRVWELFFDAYIAQHDYAAAAGAADVLARIGGDSVAGRTYRWRLAMAERRYDDAVRFAQEITGQRGAFGVSWAMLGLAYQAKGKFGEALVQFRTALDIQSNVLAYAGQAQCYYALGQIEQARDALDKGYQATNDPRLREMLLLHDTDRASHAAEVVNARRALLNEEPGNPARYAALAHACIAAADQASSSDQAEDFARQAHDTLLRASRMFPAHPELLAQLRQMLQVLLKRGDYSSVIRHGEQLVSTGMDTWWVHEALGRATCALGDRVRGGQEFDRALSLAEQVTDFDAVAEVIDSTGVSLGTDEARSRLASRLADDRWRLVSVRLEERAGNWATALEQAQPLLARTNSLTSAQRLQLLKFAAQAYQLAAEGDSTKADALQKSKALYGEFLRDRPTDRGALNNLAWLLAEDLKQPTEAKQYSLRAYEAEQKSATPDPTIADTHGWVLTLCGGRDAPEGIHVLTSVVTTHPDMVEAQYHLGMAFLMSKRPAQAVAQFTAAIETLKQRKDTGPDLPSPKLAAKLESALKRAQAAARENSAWANQPSAKM